MKHGSLFLVAAAALAGCTKPDAASTSHAVEIKPLVQTTLDLDKAVPVKLAATTEPLKPVPFTTPDGKSGWSLTIPGGRPIATPAYEDGLLFVGGGFGSHEFYAFHADSGKLAWKIKTSDDGPTAAVVQGGRVAFNTESCTVIVTDAKTGRLIWEEWLGDPLMSQPAISDGRLYIAYPAGQKDNPKNRTEGYTHRLLCADLETGDHFWEQEIPADVISAPVIEGDAVYITCMEGTSMCLNAKTGEVRWKKKNSGTSAPLVVGGQIVSSAKEVSKDGASEGMIRWWKANGAAKDAKLVAKGRAGYLEKDKGGGVSMQAGTMKQMDSSVGFSEAPAAAALPKANEQLGVNTVSGGWAYQGSRAAHSKGLFFNAQGTALNSMDRDGRGRWKVQVKGKAVSEGEQHFSPPALGKKNMYLTSGRGHFLAVRQEDGARVFAYDFGQPIAFQPALANGSFYAGTANGMIICLKTGDSDADGWTMWGGNAQHNKSEKK